MQGYCMKCREKREMKDVQQVTLKNGRDARQGTCAVCGTMSARGSNARSDFMRVKNSRACGLSGGKTMRGTTY